MFTLDVIDQKAKEKETEPVFIFEYEGETYKYREPDGIDRARFADLPNSAEEAYKFVLATCLLDGKTEKPIGPQYAYKFIRNDFDAADAVCAHILKAFVNRKKEEDDAVETERKNSDATPRPCTVGGIANDSDSTREPRS